MIQLPIVPPTVPPTVAPTVPPTVSREPSRIANMLLLGVFIVSSGTSTDSESLCHARTLLLTMTRAQQKQLVLRRGLRLCILEADVHRNLVRRNL